MNTAAFACVIYFERQTGSDNIFDMAGFNKEKAYFSYCFRYRFI